MLLGGWKCTVTYTENVFKQRLLVMWAGSAHGVQAFLFVFNFCLYCNRVERKTPREVSGDFLSAGSAVAFSCCWAALLLMGSGLPVPSSLPFPSFFFKAAGIRRGKDAADAGIAVGYAEPICVNPVLSLPSDPPSPLLPCSNLRCHLNTMAKWKPWLAGGAVSCLQRASFPVCSSC